MFSGVVRYHKCVDSQNKLVSEEVPYYSSRFVAVSFIMIKVSTISVSPKYEFVGLSDCIWPSDCKWLNVTRFQKHYFSQELYAFWYNLAVVSLVRQIEASLTYGRGMNTFTVVSKVCMKCPLMVTQQKTCLPLDA